MRAMVVAEFGEPLVETELPEPELEPGHALLEVAACGVCASDVKTWRGTLPWSPSLERPHVPGHEVCGRVLASDPPDAVPAGTMVLVHHFRACGRCETCRLGRASLCAQPQTFVGFRNPGGFQERLVVPLEQLVVLPGTLDPTECAPLSCALGTAYHSVVTRGGVVPGWRVAIIGLGGVGIHAIQVAEACGATAVGIDTSESALRTARRLEVQAIKGGQELLAEQVFERIGGPADVVLDIVGTRETSQLAASLLRPGGRIVAVGYSLHAELVLSSADVVSREIELVGSRYASRGELERGIALVQAGRVRAVVDRVLPLREANEALAALEEGRVTGRQVLAVGSYAER